MKPCARNTDPDTSHVAGKNANTAKAEQLRLDIYNWLYSNGAADAKTIAAGLGVSYHDVHRRMSEIDNIEQTDKRCNGGVVWCVSLGATHQYRRKENVTISKHEYDLLKLDAMCFRFWVREAAMSPGAMAKLICHCTTEQEYRDAITKVAIASDQAMKKVMSL